MGHGGNVLGGVKASMDEAMQECVAAASGCDGITALHTAGGKVWYAHGQGNEDVLPERHLPREDRLLLPSRRSASPSFAAAFPPPTCPYAGQVWKQCGSACDRTCHSLNQPCTRVCVAKCECENPSFVVVNGACVAPVFCPPAPPFPPSPSPPPPFPPFLPEASPPPAPICTPAQNDQNAAYCNAPDFDDSVCGFDNGLYCPEKCGVCTRSYPTNENTASVVKWRLRISTPIYQFDRGLFRRSLARTLSVSPAQVSLSVSAGSTVVEVTIATPSGDEAAAAAIAGIINSQLGDPTNAASLLSFPVESVEAAAATTPDFAPYAPPPPPSVHFPLSPPPSSDGPPPPLRGRLPTSPLPLLPSPPSLPSLLFLLPSTNRPSSPRFGFTSSSALSASPSLCSFGRAAAAAAAPLRAASPPTAAPTRSGPSSKRSEEIRPLPRAPPLAAADLLEVVFGSTFLPPLPPLSSTRL